MRILYVTTISDTINAFLVPHILSLIQQNYQVGIACHVKEEVHPDLIKSGCTIHDVPFSRNPFQKENIKAYKKIKSIVETFDYEVVHVHTPVASIVTRFACRSMKHIKMLYTAHGFHFYQGAPKKNWMLYYTLEKLAAHWTDGIITMNEEDYESAKKFTTREKDSVYKVSGVGIDLTKFLTPTSMEKQSLREQYGYSNEDFILVSVGELSYRKHQDLLLEATSLLKSSVKNVKLLLVGDGPLEEQYKQLATSLEITSEVAFLGYRKDIKQLMAIADVGVSASRHEGLPVNVMEAMGTGLPLVVTDCRGNRDLIEDEVNGLVVKINDPKMYAEAIQRLYESPPLRFQYSEENKKKIKDYSIENVLKEMDEMYGDTLSSLAERRERYAGTS